MAGRKGFLHAATVEETEISAGASSPLSMAGSHSWGKVKQCPNACWARCDCISEWRLARDCGTGVSALGLRMQAGSHFLWSFFFLNENCTATSRHNKPGITLIGAM